MCVRRPHSPNILDLVDCIVRLGPSDGLAPIHSCSLSARSTSHANAPILSFADASDPACVVAPFVRLLARSAASFLLPDLATSRLTCGGCCLMHCLKLVGSLCSVLC